MQNRLGWFFAALLAVAFVGSAIVPDLLPRPGITPAHAAPTPLSATGTTRAPAAPGSVRAVVEQVTPAVVQITNEQVVLDQPGRSAIAPAGVSSGVIYDAQGLILTNSHVIASARSLTVARGTGQVTVEVTIGERPGVTR